MKVAMLTTVGDRCGIAAYTRSLVEALRANGEVEVEVVPIAEGRQPLERYQEQAGLLNAADVVHIQHEHSFWGGILPGKSAFWNLRYMIDRPLVVTAHTTTSLADLLRVRQERRPFHRMAKQALLWRTGYRDSVETAPFMTGRCIVHTEAARRELAARGVKLPYLHVIPAGVPEVQPDPARGEGFTRRSGLSGRRIVSLFGFIAPNKGYEQALDALGELPEDVTLVVAGGVRTPDLEPYADGLRTRVREAGLDGRVLITGYLADEEVAEVMAASDLVLAPHTFATGSYSVMVPLAYGKAVVASDLDCFREIQAEGAGLETVPAGDAAALGRTVRRLLEDDAARAAMEGSARGYARSHSWREAARKTVGVYHEALEDETRLAHHGPALHGRG
jgi:glycosyltransferase involved in cell wall biosynthesis